MTNLLAYLAVALFVLSPFLWLVGIIATPLLAIVYIAALFVSARSNLLPQRAKWANAAVILLVLVVATAANVRLFTCLPTGCPESGFLSVLPFLISAPSVLALALYNYTLLRGAMAERNYASQIELSEDEDAEYSNPLNIFKRRK